MNSIYALIIMLAITSFLMIIFLYCIRKRKARIKKTKNIITGPFFMVCILSIAIHLFFCLIMGFFIMDPASRDMLFFWILLLISLLLGVPITLYFAIWELKFYDDKIDIITTFGRKRKYNITDIAKIRRENSPVDGLILKIKKKRVEVTMLSSNYLNFKDWLNKNYPRKGDVYL